MKKPIPKTIDGRRGLLEFARAYHPRHAHNPIDLEKLLRRLGFELTDYDEDRAILAGPLSTTTSCKMLTLSGGTMQVRHLEVVKALCKLTETGVPIWANEQQQLEWHILQLSQAEPFEVQVLEEFETRQELVEHALSCRRCQPSYQMLLSALDLGSNRHNDKHLRELIEKSHADQASAVRFYTQIRDAQRPAFITAEQVPA